MDNGGKTKPALIDEYVFTGRMEKILSHIFKNHLLTNLRGPLGLFLFFLHCNMHIGVVLSPYGITDKTTVGKC